MLLDDELVLIERLLNLSVSHLSILHFQFQLVFKSVDLFNENFSDGLFAFVDVVFADSLDDELLEVGELSGALGADLGSHLLVVVLQLPNLLQISHVQIHLLLILTLKALLLSLNTVYDFFTTGPHRGFYFVTQCLAFLLQSFFACLKCLNSFMHGVQPV